MDPDGRVDRRTDCRRRMHAPPEPCRRATRPWTAVGRVTWSGWTDTEDHWRPPPAHSFHSATTTIHNCWIGSAGRGQLTVHSFAAPPSRAHYDGREKQPCRRAYPELRRRACPELRRRGPALASRAEPAPGGFSRSTLAPLTILLRRRAVAPTPALPVEDNERADVAVGYLPPGARALAHGRNCARQHGSHRPDAGAARAFAHPLRTHPCQAHVRTVAAYGRSTQVGTTWMGRAFPGQK